jgi:hypothetical protein
MIIHLLNFDTSIYPGIGLDRVRSGKLLYRHNLVRTSLAVLKAIE